MENKSSKKRKQSITADETCGESSGVPASKCRKLLDVSVQFSWNTTQGPVDDARDNDVRECSRQDCMQSCNRHDCFELPSSNSSWRAVRSADADDAGSFLVASQAPSSNSSTERTNVAVYDEALLDDYSDCESDRDDTIELFMPFEKLSLDDSDCPT